MIPLTHLGSPSKIMRLAGLPEIVKASATTLAGEPSAGAGNFSDLTLSDLKVRRFLRSFDTQKGAVKTPLDVQDNYLLVLQLRLLFALCFRSHFSTLASSVRSPSCAAWLCLSLSQSRTLRVSYCPESHRSRNGLTRS